MGDTDLSGADGKNKRGEDDLFLAYVVMTIVRWDVFLVQIAIMCHRVPGPNGTPVILLTRSQSSLEPVLYAMSEWI